MKQVFVAILLLCSSNLLAQESNHGKNAIEISGGAAIGYRIEGKTDYSNVDVGGAPTFNYRFGLDYKRHIIAGLYAKIGLRYANWGLENNITTENGLPILLLEQSFESRQTMLEIPIALQYQFGQKKLKPYVELGGNFMTLISDEFYIDNNPHYPNIPSTNRYGLAIQTAVGLNYQLSPLVSLFGQLSSRIQVIDMETGFFPYEIGAEIGVGFNF